MVHQEAKCSQLFISRLYFRSPTKNMALWRTVSASSGDSVATSRTVPLAANDARDAASALAGAAGRQRSGVVASGMGRALDGR